MTILLSLTVNDVYDPLSQDLHADAVREPNLRLIIHGVQSRDEPRDVPITTILVPRCPLPFNLASTPSAEFSAAYLNSQKNEEKEFSLIVAVLVGRVVWVGWNQFFYGEVPLHSHVLLAILLWGVGVVVETGVGSQ